MYRKYNNVVKFMMWKKNNFINIFNIKRQNVIYQNIYQIIIFKLLKKIKLYQKIKIFMIYMFIKINYHKK